MMDHLLLDKDPSLLLGVISTLPVGVFTVDPSGYVTSANPKLFEIFGIEPPVTQEFRENLFTNEYARTNGVDKMLAEVLESGEGQVKEMRMLTPQGKVKRVQLRLSVLRGPPVESRGVLGIITDFDQVDRLEERVQSYGEELERANRELRSLDEHKNRFLANVSHELRTPLVTLLGYLELAVNEKLGAMPPPLKKPLNIALSQGKRLKRQIDELLTFSARSAHPRIALGPVDSRKSLRSALQVIRPLAEKKEISISLAGSLHPIIADEERLTQVLIILLDNAVKFAPVGGSIALAVGYRDEKKKTQLLFAVSDDGPGIPEEYRERVFTRFFQVDSSATRGHQGLGLGLAMAREVVEVMGGQIWADHSDMLGGAMFSFTIPAQLGLIDEDSGPLEGEDLLG